MRARTQLGRTTIDKGREAGVRKMEALGAFTDPELLFKGATALANFHDAQACCFLRATVPTPLNREPQEAREPQGQFPSGTGATSSNRAFLATLELLFHFSEEQLFEVGRTQVSEGRQRWQKLGERLHGIVLNMNQGYYSRPLNELTAHSKNGRNDFTDSHLTIALGSLRSRFAQAYLDLGKGGADSDQVKSMADELEGKLEEGKGARLSSAGPPHPLITLHAVRAVEVARHVTGDAEGRSRVTDAVESTLRSHARDDVLRQFGLHAAEDAEFDPAALIAGAALLYRFAGLSARKLVHKSLEILADSQGLDGSWKTRILTGDRQLIYIPSLDLAVMVANLALWDLAAGSLELSDLAEPILLRSLSFLQSGYREAESEGDKPSAGWANDQARQPDVAESWSTALALQLLLRTHRIVRRANQHRILEKYRVQWPESARREWLRWYDLAGPVDLVRSEAVEESRAKLSLERLSDPSASGAVFRAAWVDVVQPVLRDAFDRPQQTRAFLLYGPAGTRKTSMVRAIATALDWPLVTLAPPDFLHGGIAAFEAQAEKIFQELLCLRRVVVFFDECEELFRRRTVINAPEHRTQSDFITSGMLPRLQDLRDGRWVVFAIATNTELDEIDPAVSRFGRLDGQQRIGHPEVGAQLRYLTKSHKLEKGLSEVVHAALTEYESFLDSEVEPVCRSCLAEARRVAAWTYAKDGDLRKYFQSVDHLRASESELPTITFSVLDQMGPLLAAKEGNWSPGELRSLIDRLCANKGRPPQWTDPGIGSG